MASGSWTAAATNLSKAETEESHRTASTDLDCGKRLKYLSPEFAISPPCLPLRLLLAVGIQAAAGFSEQRSDTFGLIPLGLLRLMLDYFNYLTLSF